MVHQFYLQYDPDSNDLVTLTGFQKLIPSAFLYKVRLHFFAPSEEYPVYYIYIFQLTVK